MSFKGFFPYILLLMSSLTAFGYTPADTAKVYFRLGYRQVDPTFAGNQAALDRFVNSIKDAMAHDDVHHIVVRTSASPDGGFDANIRLSQKRSDEIVKYLVRHAEIDPALIEVTSEGIAWIDLRRLVAQTSEVPMQDQVLDIIDNSPVWSYDNAGNITGSRKQSLMNLGGGVPYNWMLEHLFPQLRSAMVISLFRTSYMEAEDRAREAEEAARKAAEQQAVEPDTTTEKTSVADSVIPEIVEKVVVPELDEVVKEEPVYRLAIKSNLLYDAALIPNLEIEWRINRHWSLLVEGNVAWWKNDPKHKYYQIAMVSPEARYWFLPTALWKGWYMGAFVGGGKYDLENGGMGYYGEGAMGGISAGYMWHVGKHFIIETGLGAGYMFTRYKEYIPRDSHYVYQRTKNMNYFGPLKAKVSIGWRFHDINKSKKMKQHYESK